MRSEKFIILVDDNSKAGYLHDLIRANRLSLPPLCIVYTSLNRWSDYTLYPDPPANAPTELYLPFYRPAELPDASQKRKFGNRIVDMLLLKNILDPATRTTFVLINFHSFFLCDIIRERLNVFLVSYIDSFKWEIRPDMALPQTTASEEKMVSSADRIICYTPEARQFIHHQYQVPLDKTFVWEYQELQAVDPSIRNGSPDPVLKLSDKEIMVFLYIDAGPADFIPKLIRLIAAATGKNQDFRIAIFCSRINLEILKDLDAATVSRLIFIGTLGQKDILKFIQAADIAIMYSAREIKNNIPVTVISRNKPVIATPAALPVSLRNKYPENIRTMPFYQDQDEVPDADRLLLEEWIREALNNDRTGPPQDTAAGHADGNYIVDQFKELIGL